MIPQEKAKELVNKYYQLAQSIEWTDQETSVKAEKFNDELGNDVLIYWNELAKQSALIAVEYCLLTAKYMPETMKYWNEVKQEIEKL